MSSRKKKRTISILLSLLVVAITVFLISRQGLSMADIKATVTRYSILTLVLVTLCNVLQNLCMMVRLGALVRGSRNPVSPRRVLRAIGIGQMANAVLPARAGDFGKVYFLSGEEGGDKGRLSVAGATAIVLADKVMDTLAFACVLLFSGALFLPEIREKFNPTTIALVVVLLVAVGFVIRKKISRKRWGEFVAGFRGVVEGKTFAVAMAAALGVWVTEALSISLLVWGLDHSITWDRAFFVLAFLNVAIAVPVSVGNLGTFEASIAMALRAISIPLPEAIGIALMHHFLQVLAMLVWFLIALVAKKRPPIKIFGVANTR